MADAPLLVGATPDRGVVPLAESAPAAPVGVIVPEPPAGPAARHGAKTDEQRRRREELLTIRPPLPGTTVLRMTIGVLLGVISVLSLAGGVLLLLLWQQDRSSGVLSTQVDRTWDLIARLKDIEIVVAWMTLPFVVAWAGLASLNVRRVTGVRRNPAVVAASIPIGVGGVWLAGNSIVEPAEDWVGIVVGLVLQAIAVLVPLVALERVAMATDAPRRPLRVTAALAVLILVQLAVLDGISTVEETLDPTDWGRLGAYLIIAALLQAVAALAANEGARNIDDAAQHRFNLRRTFGATVVGQTRW